MKPQMMTSSTNCPRSRRLPMLALSLALVGQQVFAAVDISTMPLLTGASVPPNIMFILDDSGSMQWEVMPDENVHFSNYLFPPPSQVYGASMYTDNVPDFDDRNLHNFFGRSPTNNTLFYNPVITYTPWINGSGVSFGDASVTSAKYNPARGDSATINLRGDSKTAGWFTNTSNTDHDSAFYSNSGGFCYQCRSSFKPATFYIYKGTGSVNVASSYVKYWIDGSLGYKKDLATTSTVSVSTFSWPGGIQRTVEQELQNFANWFSYYRSRVLAARAGASIAFAQLGPNYRVGFTTINQRGVSSYTHFIPNVGLFEGSNRTAWYDKLLGVNISTNGTPLRSALKWAGDYYSGKVSGQNPWGPSPEVSCRQSFTILTTDGYWNGTSPGVGNADGSSGPTITSSSGESYQYEPVLPYRDDVSDTLGDVGLKYWSTDLRPGLDNNVPTSSADPAFWQHMVTFGLSIGVRGVLDPATDLPSLKSGAKNWPNPNNSDIAKIDDLWHAAVNSRGTFKSSANPQEFADGLRSALSSIAERSASASNLSGNTSQISAGSVLFQGKFFSGTWTGDVVAWRASDVGNGAAVPLWHAAKNIPAPADRKIYTRYNGSTVAFDAGTMAGKLGFGAQDPALANYIRGERVTGFRERAGVLGDIADSSPLYVGAPENRAYERYSWSGASSYQKFRSDKRSRRPVVYVGANDGMLHAFDTTVGLSGSGETGGKEIFAYIPSELLPRLKELADVEYPHKFFVDGDLTVSDVYIGGAWKSILVGALGRGGKSLFALDVTDPDNISILWEFSHSELGNVLGKAQVLRLNNGDWAVAVGNGYNSSNDEAVLFLINAETGSLIKRIATGAKGSNGLAGVGGWDEPLDGNVDYLYAGDLLGNLWKFDLTGSNTGNWSIPSKGGKLFTAKDSAGTVQPITAAPTIGAHPLTGEKWVFFGTGRYISSGDPSVTSMQTWYGLRDVSASISGRGDLVERKIIQEGSSNSGPYRVFSATGDSVGGEAILSVNADGSLKYLRQGWYIDLVLDGTTPLGERMIARNTLLTNTLLGQSLVPSGDACTAGATGWVMAIDPWLGGRLAESFFDLNGNKVVDKSDGIVGVAGSSIEGKTVTAGGIAIGNGGVPNVQEAGDDVVSITVSPVDGGPLDSVVGKSTVIRGRLSWKEFVEK